MMNRVVDALRNYQQPEQAGSTKPLLQWSMEWRQDLAEGNIPEGTTLEQYVAMKTGGAQ